MFNSIKYQVSKNKMDKNKWETSTEKTMQLYWEILRDTQITCSGIRRFDIMKLSTNPQTDLYM
jgi:hypothetical protein